MKKILVIMGNPVKDSFCGALADAYVKGAKSIKAKVRRINICDMKCFPYLKYGYKKRIKEEKDLLKAKDDIKWADHLVFVYPTWWGTPPALMSGFIERVFTPGFAFKYHKDDWKWDQLLSDKSARLIVTMDAPPFFYRFFTKAPGHMKMRNSVLGFCGVKPVKITSLGSVRYSDEKKRRKWLEKVEQFGKKLV